ncbi:MAG: hypothetical protein ACYDGZ_25980 [Desulfosporosinus fructosivorans]
MATTTAKGVGACERGPSGLGSTERNGGRPVSSAAGKAGDGETRGVWHGDGGRFLSCISWLVSLRRNAEEGD